MTAATIEKRQGTEGTEGTANAGAAFSGSPAGSAQGTGGTIKATRPLESPPTTVAEPKVERPGFATHDDWFRLNGALNRPGLYFHGYGKGQDPELIDSWVCSPIHAKALTANEQGAAFGLVLRFLNAYGKWREWAAPMHLLKGDGADLRGELLDMGVRINPQATRLLVQWMMSSYPKRQLVAALRTGWHEGPEGRAFVLPNRVLGADDVRFQSEHAAHDDFTQAGTLEGWREHVGRLCHGNPILLLGVSAAFAGPLLKVAKLQETGGAGIHLKGDSSLGKTTVLQAAASVWGAPTFVRTWRATSNGLEATAAALNDTLLVLDEISECDPREIGAIVYALGNGVGKQRARRTGGVRDAARWRIMAVSSGERSLAAQMGEAGKRAKAGQEARLLDLPATNRAHGAFDTLHGRPDGRTFADDLKRATASNYGQAGPAFVEALLADPQDLPAMYAAACNLPTFKGKDGVEARAAGVFALLGMAGELATEYGLTGWGEGEAMSAAIAAFDAWRSARGHGQTETRQILEAVREFVQRNGDSRFSSLEAEAMPVRDRAGYWRDTTHGRIYLFNSPALKEAGGGFDLRRILDALEAAGWIAEQDHGKRSKKVKVAGSAVSLYAVLPDEEGAL